MTVNLCVKKYRNNARVRIRFGGSLKLIYFKAIKKLIEYVYIAVVCCRMKKHFPVSAVWAKSCWGEHDAYKCALSYDMLLAWVPAKLIPGHKIIWSGSWVWGSSVGEKICPNKSCSDQSNCQGGLYTMMDR